MEPFLCSRCGAVQNLPEDLSALATRCPFCGQENAIPAEQLRLRTEQERARSAKEEREREIAASQQTQRTASRTILLVVTLVVALPVLGSIVFVVLASRAPSTAVPPINITVPSAVTVVPPRPRPPPDSRATGADQTTARMKNLYQLGCKNVVMPPAEAVGERTLKADFVVDGTCVRLLVITGAPDNTLSLAMKTPFGEKIDTPPPSTDIDFTYCPKTAGPHPTTITPAVEDAPYTVAAVECPGSLSKKK